MNKHGYNVYSSDIDLTLTSVVFEYDLLYPKSTKSIYLTLTSVVFESPFPISLQILQHNLTLTSCCIWIAKEHEDFCTYLTFNFNKCCILINFLALV